MSTTKKSSPNHGDLLKRPSRLKIHYDSTSRREYETLTSLSSHPATLFGAHKSYTYSSPPNISTPRTLNTSKTATFQPNVDKNDLHNKIMGRILNSDLFLKSNNQILN